MLLPLARTVASTFARRSSKEQSQSEHICPTLSVRAHLPETKSWHLDARTQTLFKSTCRHLVGSLLRAKVRLSSDFARDAANVMRHPVSEIVHLTDVPEPSHVRGDPRVTARALCLHLRNLCSLCCIVGARGPQFGYEY